MKKLLLLLLFVSFAAQGQSRIDGVQGDNFENNILTIHDNSIHRLPVEYVVLGEEYQVKMLDYFWPRIGTIQQIYYDDRDTPPRPFLAHAYITDPSPVPWPATANMRSWPQYFDRALINNGWRNVEKRVWVGGRLDDLAAITRVSSPENIYSLGSLFRILTQISVGDEVRIERFGGNTQWHFAVEDVQGVFNN